MAEIALTSATQRRVAKIVERQLGIKLIGIIPVRAWDVTTRWYARSDKNADYTCEVKLSDVVRFGVSRGLFVSDGREIFINAPAKQEVL